MNLFSHIKTRELVGIDLDGDELKIAHMRISAGRRELLNMLSSKIGDLSDSDISKMIRGSFKVLKARKPSVVNIIPSSMIITKNIEVPSTNPKEIKEIINLQASRYTPYSREEIIVDYIDIDTHKHSYTKILLVIVGRSAVKRQFDILDKAGIRLEKAILVPESLACSVPRALKLQTDSTPACIVHISESASDFLIVYKNKPIFIRNIPVGARRLSGDPGANRGKFAEEIKNSLEAYQSEDIGKMPHMLVVTGDVKRIQDPENVLKGATQLPSKIMPYFEESGISYKALKGRPAEERMAFMNVIASLSVHDEVKINLIPDEIKVRKSVEDRGRDLIWTGLFLLTIFVLFFSILMSDIYFKSTQLAKLEKRYGPLNTEAKLLDADFNRMSVIRKYLSGRGYSVKVMAELYDAVPVDIELNDIRFEKNGKFSVKGTAESMSTVFLFVDNMEKSEYFKDAKTKYTTKRKDGEKDVTDFEIDCLLDEEGGG